jgi:hypothetical protein
MIEIDVPYIFERAGGPRGLLNILDRHVPDHGVPYATVQMWQQRKSIPGRLIAAVLYAMYRQGEENLLLFFTDLAEPLPAA